MEKKLLIGICVGLIVAIAIVAFVVFKPHPQAEKPRIEFNISAENDPNLYVGSGCSLAYRVGVVGYFTFEVKEGETWRVTIELTEIPEGINNVMLVLYEGHWDKGENHIATIEQLNEEFGERGWGANFSMMCELGMYRQDNVAYLFDEASHYTYF